MIGRNSNHKTIKICSRYIGLNVLLLICNYTISTCAAPSPIVSELTRLLDVGAQGAKDVPSIGTSISEELTINRAEGLGKMSELDLKDKVTDSFLQADRYIQSQIGVYSEAQYKLLLALENKEIQTLMEKDYIVDALEKGQDVKKLQQSFSEGGLEWEKVFKVAQEEFRASPRGFLAKLWDRWRNIWKRISNNSQWKRETFLRQLRKARTQARLTPRERLGTFRLSILFESGFPLSEKEIRLVESIASGKSLTEKQALFINGDLAQVTTYDMKMRKIYLLKDKLKRLPKQYETQKQMALEGLEILEKIRRYNQPWSQEENNFVTTLRKMKSRLKYGRKFRGGLRRDLEALRAKRNEIKAQEGLWKALASLELVREEGGKPVEKLWFKLRERLGFDIPESEGALASEAFTSEEREMVQKFTQMYDKDMAYLKYYAYNDPKDELKLSSDQSNRLNQDQAEKAHKFLMELPEEELTISQASLLSKLEKGRTLRESERSSVISELADDFDQAFRKMTKKEKIDQFWELFHVNFRQEAGLEKFNLADLALLNAGLSTGKPISVSQSEQILSTIDHLMRSMSVEEKALQQLSRKELIYRQKLSPELIQDTLQGLREKGTLNIQEKFRVLRYANLQGVPTLEQRALKWWLYSTKSIGKTDKDVLLQHMKEEIPKQHTLRLAFDSVFQARSDLPRERQERAYEVLKKVRFFESDTQLLNLFENLKSDEIVELERLGSSTTSATANSVSRITRMLGQASRKGMLDLKEADRLGQFFTIVIDINKRRIDQLHKKLQEFKVFYSFRAEQDQTAIMALLEYIEKGQHFNIVSDIRPISALKPKKVTIDPQYLI